MRLQRKESARMKPIAYLSLSLSSSSLKDERIKVFKVCVCVKRASRRVFSAVLLARGHDDESFSSRF